MDHWWAAVLMKILQSSVQFNLRIHVITNQSSELQFLDKKNYHSFTLHEGKCMVNNIVSTSPCRALSSSGCANSWLLHVKALKTTIKSFQYEDLKKVMHP
jgi:hypothetical protein